MKKEKLHIKTFFLLLLAIIFGGMMGIAIDYAELNYPTEASIEDLPELLQFQTELFVVIIALFVTISIILRRSLKINGKTIVYSILTIIPISIIGYLITKDFYIFVPLVLLDLLAYFACALPIIISQDKIKKGQKVKPLFFGFYSEKHYEKSMSVVISFVYLAIILMLLPKNTLGISNALYVIFFVVLCAIVFLMVLKINLNELMPILKSGNYVLLDKFYNKLKNNERINNQTTYFVYLIRQYFLMFINLEEFRPDEITITSNSKLAVKFQYYSTLGLYYVFTNKWNELHQLLETCPNFLIKTKNNFVLMEKALNSTEKIEGIDKKFPIKKDDLVSTLVFAYIKMKYFEKRNELEKAKVYANFILDKKTCFEELNTKAKEIL